MARERESTRSREETSSSPRSRERSRGDNDDRSTNRSKKGGSGRKIAINLDPTTYEQYGLWGDGEDILIQDVWAAPFNYGGKMRDDGKPQTTLAIWTEYLDEATGETHVEPVSYGDLKHYAPGNSPNEFDYAGGDENTWARIANGEEQIADDMRGPYILPVPQGFDDDGNPIYRRTSGTRGSNGDFYLKQAIECGKAAGVPIKFDPDDPNLHNLLVGVRGRIAKLSNTLRKGGGGEGFGGDKSKPLVLEEIYERVDIEKGSGGRKRAAKEDEDEKPAERTRSRRGAEAKEDTGDAEKETAEPSPRRRGSRKSTEPTPEFLKDFEEKVEAFLAEQPKKSCKRRLMDDVYMQYDPDSAEERWALELIKEDQWVDKFWNREPGEGLFDYDEETDTAKL